MVEGVIQKSKKILKIANNLGLESWGFLAEYAKGIGSEKEEPKEEEETNVVQEEVDEIEDDVIDKQALFEHSKYIQDVIGGRPVLGYPSEKGGFRLRYGRQVRPFQKHRPCHNGSPPSHHGAS